MCSYANTRRDWTRICNFFLILRIRTKRLTKTKLEWKGSFTYTLSMMDSFIHVWKHMNISNTFSNFSKDDWNYRRARERAILSAFFFWEQVSTRWKNKWKSLELAVLRFQAQCTHKLAKLIVYMYALWTVWKRIPPFRACTLYGFQLCFGRWCR